MCYAILSHASKYYLDGRRPGIDNPLLGYSGSDPSKIYEVQWVIQSVGSGYYALRSLSGLNFLDGRRPGLENPLLGYGNNDPTPIKEVHWKIIKLQSGRYAILSRASDLYLDGRRPGITDPLLGYSKQDPNQHDVLEWSFVPVNYKLYLQLTDFRYDNPEKYLEISKTPNLIDSHTLTVDESVLGSGVQRMFRKTLTESFAWGFNESITIGTEFKIKAGIPLLAESQFSVSASFTVGSTQDWTKTSEHSIELSASMVPRETGTFKMEGFVYVVNDVQLKFTANLVATAKGTRVSTSGGNLVMDTPLDAAAVESILKFLGYTSPIISSKGSSVVMSTSGTLTGTYGVKTTTNIVKVA